jgi:hypothetical protein
MQGTIKYGKMRIYHHLRRRIEVKKVNSIIRNIASGPLKGLCHKMNVFLKVYNNKEVLSVHPLIGSFIIFCCLVDEKIKLKVLACSFEITC